jgi:SAM-dependent methyltransferase
VPPPAAPEAVSSAEPDTVRKEPSEPTTAPKSERPPPTEKVAAQESPAAAEKPAPAIEKPAPAAEKPAPAAEKPAPAAESPAPRADKPPPPSSLGPRPVAAPPRPASIPDRESAPPAIPDISPPDTSDRTTPPPAQSPSELGLQSGGSAARASPPKRITRPPPRRSEPPAPAHIIVPTDTVPQASKPTPAPAIQVMRIIAIGTPTEAPRELGDADLEELSDDFDEVTPAQPRTQTVSEVDSVEAAAKAPAATEGEATELDDADLAPDSQEGRRTGEHAAVTPEAAAAATAKAAAEPAKDAAEPAKDDTLELGREDALSVPPDEPTFAPEPSSAPQQPPPPPRRTPTPPKRAPDSARPSRKRALKKPWWEDLFGEDFSRAVPRLSDKQVRREVDFIEESLGVAKGGVVLDLGCGSGSHAVELATRGYGVVGYDLSVYQLALAADVAQEREQKINFLQGDMREMAFDETFDGIYCWNTTFGYFEEDKNVAVAERVFKALKPGGMFLVDVANRDYAAQYSPSQLWYEGDSCVCMDDMSLDFITSRLRVKRSLIFDDGRSRECTYSVRLYSLHELGKILHDAGFRVTEASGHTATPGVFFGEISPRLLVLAQRP